MNSRIGKGISAVALVVCFGAGNADAQTCFGGAAISANAPLQVSSSASLASTTRLTAGVAGGNESVFGGLNILRINYPADPEARLDAFGSTGFGAVFGGQFSPDRERRMSVCPVVSYSRAGGSREDESRLNQAEAMGGVVVGYTAFDTGTIRVIPTAGLTVGRISFSEVYDGETTYSDGAAIGHLTFGLGVVMNERFALVPRLSVPFLSLGEDWGQQTAFQIAAVISFGR